MFIQVFDFDIGFLQIGGKFFDLLALSDFSKGAPDEDDAENDRNREKSTLDQGFVKCRGEKSADQNENPQCECHELNGDHFYVEQVMTGDGVGDEEDPNERGGRAQPVIVKNSDLG